MHAYRQKSYGRNEEVAELFRLFDSGKNVSMHGPRRLGKTFVLNRMVEQGREYRYTCAKLELAGCTDINAALRMICEAIEQHRSGVTNKLDTMLSRARHFWRPSKSTTLEESAVRFDWETHLEKLLSQLHSDAHTCWAILIDELPIFLKALHDTGDQGILAARHFMNLLARLTSTYPNVRWLVTGSIGIMPLAKAGEYQGILAKLHAYTLHPLTEDQAVDFILDLPRSGQHQHRAEITQEEAQAIVQAVSWRSAYYLEAFAHHLPRTPQYDTPQVQENIEDAQRSLLADTNAATFTTWEEHITKHHGTDRDLSFACLEGLCQTEQGMSLDGVLSKLGKPDLSRSRCLQILTQLCNEGFLYQEDPSDESCPYRFRIPLLRLWWRRYQPGT
jgi:hypothetical protein